MFNSSRTLLLAASFLFAITAESNIAAQTATETGTNPSEKGTLVVCKEIDDKWKCVGESSEWPANMPFNVLFKNSSPVGVASIGIVIHRQGPDGKDVDFISEYKQTVGANRRSYASVGEMLTLPAGVYSIYIISWDKRERGKHRGNFKEYFAKAILSVK